MKRLSLNSAIERAAAGMQEAALGKRYIATVHSVTDRETTGWVICDVFFRDAGDDGRVTVRVNASVDLAANDLIYIKHDPAGQKTFIFDGFVKGGGTGHNDAGAFIPWVQSPGATSPVGHDYNIDPAAGRDIILDGVNWSTFHELFHSLEYVLMSAHGQVANERVLTGGDGISLADGGAGAAATLAVDLVDAWSGLEFDSGELRVDLDAVFDFASDVSVGGDLSVGTTTPNYDFEIYAAAGQADIALSGASVNQPATAIAAANVAALIGANSSTTGGLYVRALSDTDATAMILAGIMGTANPTDTTPAIILRAHKSDGGTAVAALGAAETVLQVQNHLTNLITVLGDGKVGFGAVAPRGLIEARNGQVILSDPDVAHGMFGWTDVLGLVQMIGGPAATAGGLDVAGYSDTDAKGLQFSGIIGTATPTNTTPAMTFAGGKKNVATWQALAADETLIQFFNYTTALITVLGNGYTGFGEVRPLAPVHISVDDLGALTMPVGNVLLLEQDNNAFMNMVSGVADHVGFRFGDPADTDIGYIAYENNNDAMAFGTATVERMRIDSSGNVTIPSGDLFFVNAGSGLIFGSCYGNHIAWQQIGAVQNTWYNISIAAMNDGQFNGVTHDGDGMLTVTEPGRYLITYSLCYQDDKVNDHIEVGIEISSSGAAEAAGQTHSENKFADEEEHLSGCAILSLADNATIEIAIRTTDGVPAPTIDVIGMNISVAQIGG